MVQFTCKVMLSLCHLRFPVSKKVHSNSYTYVHISTITGVIDLLELCE